MISVGLSREEKEFSLGQNTFRTDKGKSLILSHIVVELWLLIQQLAVKKDIIIMNSYEKQYVIQAPTERQPSHHILCKFLVKTRTLSPI